MTKTTFHKELDSGALRLEQPSKGYRFAQDALFLSDFVEVPQGARGVDLGTGCGIVALRLAKKGGLDHIFGVEIQSRLAEMACRNVVENGLAERVTILCQDMQTLTPRRMGGPVDLVVSNPPFRRLPSGRLNPIPEIAIARHELKITLKTLVETAYGLLADGGHLAMVYTADRLTDLLAALRGHQIEPKRLQMVHARFNQPAKRVLVEGVRKGRPGLKVLPPLVSDSPIPTR